MKIKSIFKSTLCRTLLLLITASLHFNLSAELYQPSIAVFRFQKQMAKRGNAESQFKLGLMYETGSGVKKSLVLATSWYKKAARQNYKPALNRLTYLEIKKSGFNNNHREWLMELKADARYQEGEALFLLGQMYSEGTGVNKSLTNALELLRKAAGGNIPGSEAEIIRVENELSLLQNKYSYKKNKSIAAPDIVVPVKKVSPTRPKPATSDNIKKTARLPAKNTRKVTRPLPVKDITYSKPEIKTTHPVILKKAEPHPMDTICGGRNRFTKDCR